MKENSKFPLFESWQEGYGAFTVDAMARSGLIEYIRNQEQHHHVKSFAEELQDMVQTSGLEWKPDYLP